MNDLESALAAMLDDRASRIEPRPGHRSATLRGARRARLLSAVAAAVVPLVVAAGALASIRSSENKPAPRPAAQEDGAPVAYSFASRRGDYPHVATGTFRNVDWQLRVAGVNPGHDSAVRITLELQGPVRRVTTTSQRVFLGEELFVRYEDGSVLFDGRVAVVFGAVDPEAEIVDVWTKGIESGERTFRAELFEGYDAKAGLDADYFLAFVPAHRTGLVIANDADGREVGAHPIPTR